MGRASRQLGSDVGGGRVWRNLCPVFLVGPVCHLLIFPSFTNTSLGCILTSSPPRPSKIDLRVEVSLGWTLLEFHFWRSGTNLRRFLSRERWIVSSGYYKFVEIDTLGVQRPVFKGGQPESWRDKWQVDFRWQSWVDRKTDVWRHLTYKYRGVPNILLRDWGSHHRKPLLLKPSINPNLFHYFHPG